MRNASEAEQVYLIYGNDLYTAAVSAGGNEKKAEELLILANERLLDSGQHFRTDRARYNYLCRQLTKLGRHPVSFAKGYALPEDVEERVIKAAKLYASSGGKERSHIWSYIAAGVIFLVIILVAIIAMNFVVSDEWDEQTKAYFDTQSRPEFVVRS